MPNYNIKICNSKRDDVIEYILRKRQEGKFTVVDVGGSMVGWSAPFVDAIIDFNEPNNSSKHITHFKCDITHPDSWDNILKYTAENGKFDFCICTHTLEDIMNPGYVSEQIAKIAKEGYIAVPSKHIELSRFEIGEKGYRGYIHHRWIFDMVDDIFIGYPKINYLDASNIFDVIASRDYNKTDLTFFWKDNINISYINNNFLGPNVQSVINYYNSLIKK